ncbi:acyl-CoA synthetase short-chain family member 3, mitochondrial-like isoform X2 [Littorina saxatilis]|uniref:Acyl-CoA synthetase short-chain family member 3, mitochondrial n=1 Tax=Littorina saxatilis TaxID=31220 RepID=A0AAN9B4T2_9CAEN
MAGYIRALRWRGGFQAFKRSCHAQKTRLLWLSQDQNCFQCRALSSTPACRNRYEEVFRRSIEQPDDFWAEAAEKLVWHKKWDQVLDNSNPPFTRWFVGGELNTCYNAVDRHVKSGRGDQAAIIHDSPVTASVAHITYKQLQEKVSLLAGVLRKHGVQKGDRVLIYMPMIPEAVIAMLACARLGAIHSLVFGGFASKELATRVNHAEPKVVISANCGVEPTRVVPYKPMLDGAIDLSEFKPSSCIIFNRPHFDPAPLKAGRDFCWEEEMAGSSLVDCVPVSATDPIYLLYTSGTTGMPKAVVRPSGGYAVVLHWTMSNVYGMNPGDVWWAASDLGWVVGHSYIAYAPLLHGNTSVLFEGKPVGTPDPGTFFRVIRDHNVKGMFTAPTALRAIRAEDPEGKFAKKYLPTDSFKVLFVAGEHCDHETMDWTKNLLQTPVLDNWWQTETGWPITSTCYGLDMDLNPPSGVTGKPVPGWNVKVFNAAGKEAEVEELGEIYVKLPLPPSFSTLWKADERFKETYFTQKPGYYATMDSGVRDEHGYICVMSRSDDVINVAGHRMSAGALEEAILECGDVVEAAVVGVPDKLKGMVPLGLCVIKHDCITSHEEMVKNVIEAVRKSVGPVAAFKKALIVPKLPKTRSGKVARNTLAAMAAGKPFQIPVTIEDASVYPSIKEELLKLGIGTQN